MICPSQRGVHLRQVSIKEIRGVSEMCPSETDHEVPTQERYPASEGFVHPTEMYIYVYLGQVSIFEMCPSKTGVHLREVFFFLREVPM